MELIERVQLQLATHYGDPAAVSAADIAEVVRAEAGVISDVELLDVMRRLHQESSGAGQLDQLLALPGVTDVLVNGPEEVWFDRGNGLERSSLRFESDASIRQLAVRLAVACGRRLDDAQPFADGRLMRADGSSIRIHAIIPPLSDGGTCLSLRVLRQAAMTLDSLVSAGSLPAEAREILGDIVQQRKSFLVAGGTGSGKTTMLSAMLAEVPHAQRIICIEDTAELRPPHPHCVSLVARGRNVEGAGEVTMSDLLKQALRMRPDRIVLGEIRGAEVVDLLAALNTGHEGGAGTVHANSVHEVPARLESLAMLGGLDAPALRSQLAAAVRYVVMMARTPQGRRVQEIAELNSALELKSVWTFNDGGSAMTATFLAALACFFAAGGGPAQRLSPRAEILWPWLLIPAAICLFIVIRGPGLVLALSMVAAVAVRKITSMRAAQAATEAAEATSKMLGSLAGDLRAGATPHDAIVHLTHDAPAPLAELATIAAHRCASGVTPASAFAEAPDPYRDLRDAGRLWLIADQRGIALAGLLEHMQHRIDARLRHRRATAAALQGPQATALILSALPLAGLAMGTAMGANPWHFLTATLLGQVMLVIGVLLGCAGFWWVDRIVAAAGGAA